MASSAQRRPQSLYRKSVLRLQRNTGIVEIDTVYNALSLAEDTYFILAENGNTLVTEYGEAILNENFNIDEIDVQADNDVYDNPTNIDFIDFTEIDPFSEGGVRI
jgi:hypothetical protein